MFFRESRFVKAFAATLLAGTLTCGASGCGEDINRGLLLPAETSGNCINQLPGNTSPLTAQDLGEISSGLGLSVCGVVEKISSGLDLGVFFSLMVTEASPDHSILQGTLSWSTASSFVMDLWTYQFEGLPIPFPLPADGYLEKTDSRFRFEVVLPVVESEREPLELQVNIRGISGEPGPYTIDLSLLDPEE